MEFDRIVQVRVGIPARPGRAAFATGYLVAPHLVLTAAHVVGALRPGEGTVTVRRPEGSENRFAATVVWHRNDGTMDAALIEVNPDNGWQPPESLRDLRIRPPQRWGHLIGTRPHQVTVCGYPRMQNDSAGRRDEQLTGDIHPGTGRLASRYEVLSTNPTLPYTQHPGSTITKWSGISGAALMCGDLLTGLVAQDRQAPVGTRLTATRTSDLLTAPTFRALIAQHTGWPPLLEPVEPDHLLAPVSRVRDLRSPAMLLRADTEAVTFHGRERELQDLLDWCHNAPDAFAVHLLTGPGGQGKTRLARHLAATLRETGWVAGQLRTDLGDAPHGQSLNWGALDTALPLLLVVDYAETLPRQVRRLIEHLRLTRHRTRLLLIARAEGDWKTDSLGAGADARAVLATAPTIELAPLLARSGGPETRVVAFTHATRDLAELLEQVPSLPQTDWQSLASTLRPPRDLDHPRYSSALTLQMTSLAALLQGGPAPVGIGPGEAVEALLLAHEARYWEGTATSPMFQLGDLRPVALRRAVAAAALCGASNHAEALAITRNILGLPPGREWDIAEWLQALYPPSAGQYWGSLQPDLLAEFHAAKHLTNLDVPVLAHLWIHATENQQVRAFTVLVRAAGAHAIAERAAAVSEVLHALDSVLDTVPPSARVLQAATGVLRLHPRPPYSSPAFTSLGLRLNEQLTTAYRSLAVGNPDAYGPEVIEAMNNLAARYLAEGRRADALGMVEKAVYLGRRLVRVNAEAVEPRLAVALRNRSTLLTMMGRQSNEETLATAEEIVAIERRLARANRDGDAPYLAMALYQLSRQLGRSVETQGEALAAIEEAIAIYRRLIQANPDYEPSLASALSVLSGHLYDADRQDEAGAAMIEGDDIRMRWGRGSFGILPMTGLRQKNSDSAGGAAGPL